jgi:hypothetical protein
MGGGIVKKTVFYRTFCAFAAVLLLACTLALPISATKESATPPEGAREWDLSEDGKTLTSGFDVYTLYTLPVGYYLDYYSYYEYANPTDTYADVVSYEKDGAFVWLKKSTPTFYATEAGAKSLDAFLEGEVGKYRLNDAEYPNTSALTAETVDALEALTAAGKSKKTTEVSALRNAERYDVTAHDKTDTVATVVGAVYHMDGVYYYLGYQGLGNQFFDADGNFSYRSGSVELVPLDATLTETVEDAIDRLDYERVEYEYEGDEYDSSPLFGNKEDSISAFWCATVFFGILLPIAPLVIGLVLPHSQKRGYPKYWYVLAITAALWIFFTIVFMFVVGLG